EVGAALAAPGADALVDTWSVDAKPLTAPPGLAVRHTGPTVKQVRVALAWGDGRLRVWDVGSSRFQEVADGLPNWNITGAYLPGRPTLLTAGLRRYPRESTKGHLQLWNDRG